MKIAFRIVLGLFLLFGIFLFIGIVLSPDSSKTNEQANYKNKTWSQMNDRMRAAYIDDKMNASKYNLRKALKKQFNNPSTVSYSWLQDDHIILDTAMALVRKDLHGTAKNSFNLDKEFKATVIFMINDSTFKVESINIQEK